MKMQSVQKPYLALQYDAVFTYWHTSYCINHWEAAGLSYVTCGKLMTYWFGLNCNIQYGENWFLPLFCRFLFTDFQKLSCSKCPSHSVSELQITTSRGTFSEFGTYCHWHFDIVPVDHDRISPTVMWKNKYKQTFESLKLSFIHLHPIPTIWSFIYVTPMINNH